MSYNQNNVESVCWCIGVSVFLIGIFVCLLVDFNLSHEKDMLLQNMSIEQCIEVCGEYK